MTCVLLVGGTDSSGGAGLSRDVSFATRLGCFAKPVVTCVTAQTNSAVQKVHQVPTDVVAAQIETALNDQRPGAIKIGMVGTRTMANTIADALKSFTGPIVLDPVLKSTSGGQLGQSDALDRLLAMASLLTPNLDEAAALTGRMRRPGTDNVVKQAADLQKLGAKAVLIKGGHGTDVLCYDHLFDADGHLPIALPRLARGRRGTGCALATAIACFLASGSSLRDACQHGKAQVHNWIGETDAVRW
mgnify:CR=1 FL=1